MDYQTIGTRRIATLKIVIIYVLFGMAWIYGSDTVLGWMVHDPDVMVRIAVMKGSLFILCTATLLYVLISRFARQLAEAEKLNIEHLKDYQAVFNATNEAIFVHDAGNGRILDVNESMLSLFGYSFQEVLNLEIGRMSQGTPPYSQAEAVENIARALLEGPQVFEWLSRRKSGEVFWSEVSLKKYTTRGHDRVIAVVRDISERRRMQASLRESAARYKKLVNEQRIILTTSPAGICYIRNRRIVWANPAFDSIFGYDSETVKGMDTEAFFVGHESFESTDKKTHGSLASGRYFDEVLMKKMDGSPFWCSIAGRAVNPGQLEDGSIWIIQDISHRKLIEEEKSKLEAQLQQAQKIESIGRLAGGVAHDFNNMLSVILGHTEMVLAQTPGDHPLHGDLMEIRNAAERSANLTRQLLAFARKQTMSPKVIDLNQTVSGMLNMLKRLIGEDIHVAWKPGAGLWKVKVDPSQIDQVLANLCVNARDAITGIGNVTLETDNVTEDETCSCGRQDHSPGDYVRLSVRDDGCGMDTVTLSHVFEPFFTTKEAGVGTGLGLSTVYGVVRQNSGFIHIDSKPGTGTTVTVCFPRHRDEGEGPGPSADVPFQSGNETILLVEDEPSILAITARMLSKMGYAVLAAGTPHEAVRKAQDHRGPIHLLVTDVVMPEMNGRDLLQTLLPLLPGLQCLFMSGYTADVIAPQGVLELGSISSRSRFPVMNWRSRSRTR